MNKKAAFTLIELLITIAILGILTSIAYPLYSNHLIGTRRVQATQNLLLLSQDLEMVYQKQQSYLAANLEQLAPGIVTNNPYYQYKITEVTAQSYQISAIPKQVDKRCGTLTLDQLGEKTSDNQANINECWLS